METIAAVVNPSNKTVAVPDPAQVCILQGAILL
jgi:hypothetical protein